MRDGQIHSFKRMTRREKERDDRDLPSTGLVSQQPEWNQDDAIDPEVHGDQVLKSSSVVLQVHLHQAEWEAEVGLNPSAGA